MAADARTFELRTYVAVPGMLPSLLTRFRDHTVALFERHGMTVVGFWVASDAEGQPTETLVYLLAHASRQSAERSWQDFATDPDWLAAREASEVDGERLTQSWTSVFLEPTDFSKLR